METADIEKQLMIKCLSSYLQQANKRRLHNINVLRDFINHETEEKKLKSGAKEADLLFHETSKGEKYQLDFQVKNLYLGGMILKYIHKIFVLKSLLEMVKNYLI